jgi:hypothetical protein
MVSSALRLNIFRMDLHTNFDSSSTSNTSILTRVATHLSPHAQRALNLGSSSSRNMLDVKDRSRLHRQDIDSQKWSEVP